MEYNLGELIDAGYSFQPVVFGTVRLVLVSLHNELIHIHTQNERGEPRGLLYAAYELATGHKAGDTHYVSKRNWP